MEGEISLNEDVRKHLVALNQTIAGSYEEFEACLQKAIGIYNGLPREFTHHFNLTLNPSGLGADIRQSFLGLLDDQVTFLEAIILTTGFKLGELAMGISDGLNFQRFRIAVMCSRAMYEETASFKYYWEKVLPSVRSMLSTAPSSFRLNRLRKLSSKQTDEFRLLLTRVTAVNKILRKWHAARKMNLRGPNFFLDYKLDKRDPLYQQFTLSALKTTEWGEGKPAEVFYALLCEATHPNVGAAGLYVDTTMATPGFMTHLIRKERNSREVYSYVFDLVCRPSIECVALLDKFFAAARNEQRQIENFARKIRQVT